MMSMVLPILGAFVVIGLVFAAILYFRSGSGIAAPSDMLSSLVDGKSSTSVTSSASGSTTTVQFWMYIKDWDYHFGQEKQVLAKTDATNPAIVCPGISLHPTDNTLDIKVSLYSNGSSLATSNTGSGEAQTVTVENVPLQSWFAVSVTIYGRTLEVYINGRLVKTTILGGIPKPANGGIVIGAKGGFSGSVCTLVNTSNQLQPSDAAAFYAAGTPCSSSTPSTSDAKSAFSLFGYTFSFGVKDSSGNAVAGFSST